MPYTVNMKIRALVIWNGTVAVTWRRVGTGRGPESGGGRGEGLKACSWTG
jgi:hypothetical protein